jgi:hypothetical protein
MATMGYGKVSREVPAVPNGQAAVVATFHPRPPGAADAVHGSGAQHPKARFGYGVLVCVLTLAAVSVINSAPLRLNDAPKRAGQVAHAAPPEGTAQQQPTFHSQFNLHPTQGDVEEVPATF